MIQANTLSKSIIFTGIGLHSGKTVSITLSPSSEIGVFWKYNTHTAHIQWNQVQSSQLSTSIAIKNHILHTVEHLFATCRLLNLYAITLETIENEVPLLDGSAREWYDTLHPLCVPIEPIHTLHVKETVWVTQNDSKASFEPLPPHKSLKEPLILDVVIDFDSAIGKESYTYNTLENPEDIIDAKTFGYYPDLEKLQSMGLSLGVTPESVIGVDDKKIVNSESLSYENNNFVKHKILDAIGDLFITPYPIVGIYKAYKSGHTLNNILLKKFLQNSAHYAIQ